MINVPTIYNMHCNTLTRRSFHKIMV